MLDGEPDRKQLDALAEFFIESTALFPEEPVPAGHTWRVAGEHLTKLLNLRNASALSGEAYFHLAGVVDCDGTKCAEIGFRLEVSATVIEDGARMDLGFTGNGSVLHSLHWHQDLSGRLSGNATLVVYDGESTASPLIDALGPFAIQWNGTVEPL